MKKIIILLIFLSILNSISALNLTISEINSDDVMIAGINEKMNFKLNITNNGEDDFIGFYTLKEFKIFPVSMISLKKGETKEVLLQIYPLGEINKRGNYTFEYFIRGKDNSKIKQKLIFKIIDLKDAFEIGSLRLDKQKNSIQIYVKNKEKINFKNLDVEFKSDLFNIKTNFDLNSKDTRIFEIKLKDKEIKKLFAGSYNLITKIEYKNLKTKIKGIIEFSEKEDLKIFKKNSGFFVRTYKIIKLNEGNINAETSTLIKKNILSSIFTTLNPDPDIIEKKGLSVLYIWEKELKPNEKIEITAKTNFIFMFLTLFFIITISIFLKKYFSTDLIIKKKINYVHAKGGELALKVSIKIYSMKHLENINIFDKIPSIVKIHPRFGGEIPTRADEKRKRIEWNFKILEKGEKRILSYIIYSKIGVLGRFEIPPTTAIYEKNGKIKETISNKAYFVAEEKKNKIHKN